MNNKYKLVLTKNGEEITTEHKTLNEISVLLNVELHIIRKINKLTEALIKNEKPHYCHKELYEKVKIYNIKKNYNI